MYVQQFLLVSHSYLQGREDAPAGPSLPDRADAAPNPAAPEPEKPAERPVAPSSAPRR